MKLYFAESINQTQKRSKALYCTVNNSDREMSKGFEFFANIMT